MQKAKMFKDFLQNCTGFDCLLKKVEFINAENGNCLASLLVEKKHLNAMGSLHGGFSSTLVDVISGFALLTHKYGEKSSVTVALSLMFFRPAHLGDTLLIDAKTLRAGRHLAYLTVDIKNKHTDQLILNGLHTKFFQQ